MFSPTASYVLDAAWRLSFAIWSLGGAIASMGIPVLFVYVFVRSDVPGFFPSDPMCARRTSLSSSFLGSESAVFAVSSYALAFQVVQYIP